jgi:hypothetical protein
MTRRKGPTGTALEVEVPTGTGAFRKQRDILPLHFATLLQNCERTGTKSYEV